MPPRSRRRPSRAPAIIASLDSVADLAASLEREFLECRDDGHNWDRRGGRVYREPQNNRWREEITCLSCGSKRVRFIGFAGERIRNDIAYVEGYVLKNFGRIDARGREILRARRYEMLWEQQNPPRAPEPTTPPKAPRKRAAKKTKTE